MLPSLNHLSLPSNWQHVHLADTDSTMLQLQCPTYTHSTKEFVLMTTDYQTAGHGQKGTSWEAERGENLLFSFVFHPTLIPAIQQFALSEALALGIRAALLSFVGEGITVKWPNDIYWQDKKIAGMLLTHTLCGATIATTLTGVGLNVNQRTFISDAPNPISLRQIIGKDVPRHQVLEALLQAFELRYRQIQKGDYDALHQEYMQCLYCGKGLHTYEDAAGRFQASIQHISSTGMLHLKRADGIEKVYAFKEVKLIN